MKTVVITGSTRGIGFGLADAFLERDCNVVVSGRKQASVNQTIAKLAEKYPADRILGQPCDITDVEQVQALWDTAQAHFGEIDLWVNNAALGNPMQSFWTQPDDTLQGHRRHQSDRHHDRLQSRDQRHDRPGRAATSTIWRGSAAKAVSTCRINPLRRRPRPGFAT